MGVSLAVTLFRPMGVRVFARKDGEVREITAEEWAAHFPGTEPVTYGENETVFSANLTHNLTDMAREAGLYGVIWRPEEHGIRMARQLVEPLRRGLEVLRSDPERFRKLNPENGWGSYDGFVSFVAKYSVACIDHPDAMVSVSR